ncbi:MAG: NAD(P)/FAD-dependent oxidoreductase [Cyanobacteriota bacterium]
MRGEEPGQAPVLVVGAGIIGLAATWRLVERGHPVTLVDPGLAPGAFPDTRAAEHNSRLGGSQAALGVLMARVFHRSSGRSWRLRQRSQALWQAWLAELEQRGHRLPQRRGLLLLAASAEERARQERIAVDRARMGIPLRLLAAEELEGLCPSVPGPALGGLLSPEDGQLDPAPVMAALLGEARRHGLVCVAERVVGVERGGGWSLTLAGGARLSADWLVLAAGPGTAPLLASLGHALPLEPVLGQALELELPTPLHWTWPGTVVWRGVNLVPRPEAESGGQRLWLGATLEPGDQADAVALEAMRQLGGAAPPWLREGRVVRHWQGLRCHPIGQAAPVLMEPEPRLLVASGHYRNGILLAPATAEWIGERIQGLDRGPL